MKLKFTKLMAVAVSAALAASLAACGSSRDTGTTATGGASSPAAKAAADTIIGIAMPTKSLERWNNDGNHLVEVLQQMGYQTQLQYADNKTDQQISQIQNMVNQGASILVIASIDGTTLGPALQEAANKGVKVIAYDRLINKTPNVDYYATFDNYQVGKLQGQFIEAKLGLKDGKGPFNLEPFAGSPDDNNAKFFFAGAWDILNPYIQKGQLVVPSGKAPKTDDDWASIGIQAWKSESAQSEMQNRLNSFYTDKQVDVVLSPNDSLALGIEQALDGQGYKVGDNWPIVTGQDADLANTKNILADKQAMTVWKDTRTLGDQVAKMIDQIVKGETVDVNNTTDYNNGVKNVPSFLLAPEVVTKAEVESRLVGTGFFTKAQLGLS